MNIKEFFGRKVAGIPVLYLVIVAVGIFAFVAWKLKPATNNDPSGDAGNDGAPGSGDAGVDDVSGITNGNLSGSVYDSLTTRGTVVVAPTNDTTTDTEPTIKTNSTWINDGVAWLQAHDKATGSAAHTALFKYVNGQDRSYDEQYLVDLWYREGGPPPDGIEPSGHIGSKPAQKQFEAPPGVHTIKGGSDNSYQAMQDLYYGGRRTQESLDLLQAANEKIGGSGPWPVGTKVTIPAYTTPKYYTLPSAMSVSQICSKNGITPYQFNALNNSSRQQWKKGEKVRVK